MKNKYRDHYCDKLTEKEIGKTVKVAGFVENIRDHGGVLFLDLRDYTGEIQIVSNIEGIFDKITKQSSMSITGKIRKRSPEDYNEKISTGTIELLVESEEDLVTLGKAKNVLPFEVATSKEVSEDTRLKYRYLDLRNPKVRKNIIFRTEVIDFIRKLMKKEDFLEITTPILTASSPEGARDFIVPSRKFKEEFPEVEVYIIFTEPNFRVKVGDFTSKLDAFVFMQRIKDRYPGTIVKENVYPIHPDLSNIVPETDADADL